MSSAMSEYVPIPCGIYSEYEQHILRRHRLRLVWREDQVLHAEVLLPVDLQTRDRAEYLVVQSLSGARRALRLDWILRSYPA